MFDSIKRDKRIIETFNEGFQTLLRIIKDLENRVDKLEGSFSTKNEVLKGDVKELTKELDKAGVFDTHQDVKKELDKDYD